MAKRITDDAQKKASTLCEVFDMGESLGIVDETSFDKYEVFVFRQAAQLADETLDKFKARLRQIARNCNFHDVDREVLSQIMQKCQNSKVQDKGGREGGREGEGDGGGGREGGTYDTPSREHDSGCASPGTVIHSALFSGDWQWAQFARKGLVRAYEVGLVSSASSG